MSAAASQPQPSARTLPHILIVDDDVFNLQLLKRILQRDYRITAVPSGELALKLLQNTSFDLAVLDIMMGVTNGFDILAAIRQLPGSVDLPVIMLSALSQAEDVVRGLQLGANDYITKPFDTEVVRARVERQLTIKRALDERQATIAHLQDAHEMKDRFLRIATHDLKSPLNNIRLAQYFLRDRVGEDPEAASALDAIDETVSWMNRLVEDFLDASLLKSGGAELQLEAVTVEEVLWDVADQYSASAARKNITLLFASTEGVVLADRHRLMQIVANLVSNAIKYSPPSRFVTLSSEVRADRVRLSVADEGEGIPVEEQKDLFTAFGKLSPRPTAGESSSGLGLWIVKELAELQHGVVGVDSPPDGGSVFWVELPAATPKSVMP